MQRYFMKEDYQEKDLYKVADEKLSSYCASYANDAE